MSDRETNVLCGNEDFIEVKGEKIQVKEIPFGKLPAVARCVGNIFQTMQVMPSGIEDMILARQMDASMMLFIMELMEKNYDEVMELMSYTVEDKDKAWVAKLSPDKGLELLFKGVCVNYDFFTKKFVPLFQTMMDKVTTLFPKMVAEAEQKLKTEQEQSQPPIGQQ